MTTAEQTEPGLSDLVFRNQLILSKILSNLSLGQLLVSRQVCHEWKTEANRVIANRSQALNIYHLFRTTDDNNQLARSSSRTDEELEYCLNWTDKYDFKSNIVKSMVDNLQSVPDICLIVYGSFSEDVKLKQRLHQSEIIRNHLPDQLAKKCTIVNLSSQCLIGFPTTSSVPIDKISHFGDIAAVSMLLLPKYGSGVDITVFTGSDMREKISMISQIKAILVFTTSSIFQDNTNLFVNIETMSKLISKARVDGVAFGGYNSAYFSFNKNDLLNFLDANDHDNNELPLGAHQLIGICFSGPDVRASSIVLNTKRVTKTEQKLRQFKNNLGFKPINNHLYETLAFMFTDEEKNDAFIKLKIFARVFADCQVVGISGYGQYGFDHWPNSRSNKAKSSTAKRKIVLNTNMTTFVVVKLKKKFICS